MTVHHTRIGVGKKWRALDRAHKRQSHKRVKVQLSYYRWPIGTHQSSFERYYPRPPTASFFTRSGVRNPTPKPKTPIDIISGTGADTDWPEHSQGLSEKKPIKKFGEKGAWAHPGTAQIFLDTPQLFQERVKLYTDFKFGTYIHKVHSNKSLSQERVKRGTSYFNFVGTYTVHS